MSRVAPHPTPYPDVNTIIHNILTGASVILGEELLGMYITGSLAAGDFDWANSDIDFIIVTATEPSPETITELTAMHARIAAGGSKWAKEIEGSYLSRDALRRYDPANARHPHIFRGVGEGESSLFMMEHGSDWVIQRHVLREQGIVVVGPPPATLVDPVAPEDLRQAVRSLASLWPEPLLHDPAILREHHGYHAYTVVTLCRMLYTLEHGAIVSKPVAARWARAVHGGRWSALIDRALAWSMRPRDLPETLYLMRYTLERSAELPPSRSAGGAGSG